MADVVNAEIRFVVAARADHLCEYCLIAEEDTFFGCQVDHIISLKHRGQTKADNLAYACAFCNRFKGSDIASLSSETGALVPLFNPRLDRWSDHFQLQELSIQARTDIGEVTVRILRFNDNERIL
jgi:5-methylcytosine-specific restriction endonuclease McrA